jgi:FkbM family methyltransferase
MGRRTDRFNQLVPWPIRLVMVVAVGAGIVYSGALEYCIITGWVASLKVRGTAPDCPWRNVATYYWDLQGFSDRVEGHTKQLKAEQYDPEFDIELIAHPARSYWIRKSGGYPGLNLLGYHLAEQDWLAYRNPAQSVRPGDIVIDCGAHVGTFVNQALLLGAARVIAIDPDPTQVECLRRNFAAEIDQGRVTVVPKGVWSSEGTMTLNVGADHSGVSTFIGEAGEKTLEVPVLRIDLLVEELGLERVDFIKLDIEGAEREALRGALQVLKKYRPRLMIDSYHLPDDNIVLPGIIAGAQPDYESSCGFCDYSDKGEPGLIPHTVFYE